MPGDVIDCWRFQSKFQCLNNFRFHLKDLIFFELLPRNLIIDDSEFKGMNFLIFCSCEHCSDSDKMQVLDFEPILGLPQIGIHEVNTAEECFFTHPIGGQDFDHPVDHLGPQGAADLVPQEDARLLFGSLAQMGEDIVGVVPANDFCVVFFEVKADGFFVGRHSAVGGLANLVLHLDFAREVIILASEGLGSGQVGDVVVLLVLFAIPQARLIVGNGSVWL